MKVFLGIDLASKAEHRASLVGSDGSVLWRGLAFHTRVAELTRLWDKVIEAAGADEPVSVTVVMEPTGNAWVPVKAWLGARGARVVLVPTTQSAALRGYYKRYAKNDKLDSLVLARLPLHHEDELVEHRGDGPADPLRRLTRARSKIVKDLTKRWQQIDALLQLLGPAWAEALGSDPGAAAVELLARYASPDRVLALGPARLTRFLHKHSRGQFGAAKAAQFLAAARESKQLWTDDELDFEALAMDIAVHAETARHLRAQLREIEARMTPLADDADPEGIIASAPGVGPIGRAVIGARLGDPTRFHNLAAVRAFSGLVPKENSSGTSVHQHGLTKAGDPLLREALFRAADAARKQDPQLAATYKRLMETGRHHNSALCHIATRLLTRIVSCLRNGQHYLLRDLDGTALSTERGKQIVAERHKIDPAVRAAARTKRKAQIVKGRTDRVQQESPSAPASRPANRHDNHSQVA